VDRPVGASTYLDSLKARNRSAEIQGVESREQHTKRQIRLFGGAVRIVLGVGRFAFGVQKYGGEGIFVGIMCLIAGTGLLFFGLFRS